MACSDSGTAKPTRLFVFDYDGTLAHLAVDWHALRVELERHGRAAGYDGTTFRPFLDGLRRIRDAGGADALAPFFRIIACYERVGVRDQLPRYDVLAFARERAVRPDVAITAFSVNLHATVEAGLELLGVRPIFDAIVGLDDVRDWKPDPEGLLRLMNQFGCSPHETLFIGDSQRDAEAARAVGVAFRDVAGHA